MKPEETQKLLEAALIWAQWYSQKLDAGGPMSAQEQDLFEAVGCLGVKKVK
jgi:hypothetical protein